MKSTQDHLELVESHIYAAQSFVQQGLWLSACREINYATESLLQAATNCAQGAYMNNGATKKQIAEALGVSVSTLRGLERSH